MDVESYTLVIEVHRCRVVMGQNVYRSFKSRSYKILNLLQPETGNRPVFVKFLVRFPDNMIDGL